MMIFLMMSSLLMSIYLITLKHPLSMGLTLLIQSILISLTMGFFSLNYWYSYILFLIMIGGMLVLFIYMTSIASNELFYPSMKLFMTTMLIFTITFILKFSYDTYYLMLNNSYQIIFNQNNFYLSLNKYLNYPNNLIMYLLIIYLFITLLAVVKITNFKKGSLRQKL